MSKRLDQILVIDVESTCWEGNPPPGQISEIIQIGICPIYIHTLERAEKHSLLVKPLRSEVSEFCTRLTGLSSKKLHDQPSLSAAAHVLRQQYASHERLWASWGDYDRRQFERLCHEFQIPYPFGISHLNIKTLCSVALGTDHELTLPEAHQHLAIPMEGHHHRADDDAWNAAGLLCDLLRRIREIEV